MYATYKPSVYKLSSSDKWEVHVPLGRLSKVALVSKWPTMQIEGYVEYLTIGYQVGS